MAARVQHCCRNVSSAHLSQLVDYCGAHISIATAALTSPENLTRRPARGRQPGAILSRAPIVVFFIELVESVRENTSEGGKCSLTL